MYKIFRTTSFKKDYKKLSNKEKESVKTVITKLANKEELEEKYKDHSLIENYFGCRECHVKPNLLLIYRIDDDILELALVRVGSHSKLFWDIWVFKITKPYIECPILYESTFFEALMLYPSPKIFNTDQGSQYTSLEFTNILKKHQIKISMDGKSRMTDNITIERFWRTIYQWI